jgi:hypothetical protein
MHVCMYVCVFPAPKAMSTWLAKRDEELASLRELARVSQENAVDQAIAAAEAEMNQQISCECVLVGAARGAVLKLLVVATCDNTMREKKWRQCQAFECMHTLCFCKFS